MGLELQLPGVALSVFPIWEVWLSQQQFGFREYNTFSLYLFIDFSEVAHLVHVQGLLHG